MAAAAISAGDEKCDRLDQPADERMVVELHSAELLDAAARDAALNILAPAQHWWRWANRALLFVGTALVLAGIVFFFAHNWARMSAVARFSVIEGGLWVCAIAALRQGLNRLSGKVLLMCASMLVGVLLAVYGQVYQTGADAFENYALWALLILPWVILGKFGALWVLWLTVANVALILFWSQVKPPQDFGFYFGLFLLLSALNALALAGREYGAARQWEWLEGRWIRRLVWLSILVYLTIPALKFILEPEIGDGSLAGLAALIIALAAGFVYFRYFAPDFACLAFAVAAECVLLLTLIGKVLFEISDNAGAFLLFGMIVLGVSSAAAFFLRYLAQAMDDKNGE